ncbi:MAG: hypothetical protein LBG17_06310 [Bacteroidales bacterium]|jgi:hypothetical protein|nr:hypothetical protein [Bacteroidales bacterium]
MTRIARNDGALSVMVGVARNDNVLRGVLDFFRINNNHRVATVTADGIIEDCLKRHK